MIGKAVFLLAITHQSITALFSRRRVEEKQKVGVARQQKSNKRLDDRDDEQALESLGECSTSTGKRMEKHLLEKVVSTFSWFSLFCNSLVLFSMEFQMVEQHALESP